MTDKIEKADCEIKIDDKINDELRDKMSSEDVVFNRIIEKYSEFEGKRGTYLKTCLVLLLTVPLGLTVLMFSLDSKIVFLVLWIISILAIIAVIVTVEYKDYWYKQLLGIEEKSEENLTDKDSEDKNTAECDEACEDENNSAADKSSSEYSDEEDTEKAEDTKE